MFPYNKKNIPILPPDFIPQTPDYGVLNNETNRIVADASRLPIATTAAPVSSPPPNYSNPQLTPTEEKVRQSTANVNLPPAPQKEDYHPGTVRKVLSILGGIVGGASGHPEVGKQIENAPYDKAMEGYQSKVKLLSPNITAEEKARTAATSEDKVASLNQYHQQQLQQKDKDATTKAKEFEEKLTAQQKMNEERMKKLLSPQVKMQMIDEQLGKLDPTSDEYRRKREDLAMAFGGAQPLTEYEDKLKKKLEYTKPTSEAAAAGRVAGETSPPAIAGQAALTAAKSGAAAQGKGTVEHSEPYIQGEAELRGRIAQRVAEKKAGIVVDIPPAVKKTIESMKDHPWDIPGYVSSLDPATRKEVMKQVPFDSWVKDPAARTQIHTATVTMNHGDNMKVLIQDPWIQQNLGAITGRINKLTAQFGGDNIGKTPEEIQKEQQFLTAVTNLMTWETKNAAGGRPSYQLFNAIKQSAPNPAMGVNQITGAINAIQQSAEANINGQLGKRPKANVSAPGKSSGIDWSNIKEIK